MSSSQEELLRLYENPQVSSLVPQVATSAPLYPAEGMLRYAKSPWNPLGFGEGWVQYLNGAWAPFPTTIAGNFQVQGSVVDGKGDVRDIPQNVQAAGYILVASDNGKHVSVASGGVTVPSGVFSVSDVITIYNNSASTQTIFQGPGVTLRFAGTGTTGPLLLAQRGLATILCVGVDEFVVVGAGIS